MKAGCESHLVILFSVRKVLSVGNLLLVLVLAPVPMERGAMDSAHFLETDSIFIALSLHEV